MAVPAYNVAELLDRLDKDGGELAHYGTKGMRWGVRRSRDQLARANRGKKDKEGPEGVEVSITPGKKVQARGGSRQPPSNDAIKKAELLQKARASTTDSLSTKELQDVVSRINLEQQYAKLNPPKVGLGKEFARMVFENDKKKLASTGDWQQTSTYKLGTTALQVANFALDKTKTKKS